MSMRPLLGPLGLSGPIVDASWAYSQCLYGCYITYMTGFALLAQLRKFNL